MNNIIDTSLDVNTLTIHQNKVDLRSKHLKNIHRQHDESYEVIFHDLTIQMQQEVFCPAYGEGSDQLAKCMDIQAGEKVLEIGTGAGALSILAAEKAATVTANDISELAVACAKQNIENHQRQHKINLHQGDLFELIPTTEKFSVVVFNLPFMEGKPKTPLELAMYDEGYRTMSRFMQNVRKYLSKDGRVLIAFSTAGDVNYLHKQINLAGFNYEKLLSECINEIDFFTCRLWL
jgi:release factor glutamine methyltransferase